MHMLVLQVRAFQLSQLHFRLQMHRAKPEHSVGQVSARTKIAVTFDMQVLTLLFDDLCLQRDLVLTSSAERPDIVQIF